MNTITVSQFTLGIALGVIIACSPTKFTPQSQVAGSCSAASNCVVNNQYNEYTNVPFNVGAGKVDILFINDNSASMSKIQTLLTQRFAGFIQNLDSKQIDYRIAITTTDLNGVTKKKLTTFSNGSSYIKNSDSDRINMFNTAIRRTDTIACEDMITSAFNTNRENFQNSAKYAADYAAVCPSSDTRGLHTGSLVVSENSDSFMRTDAGLNIILISNDDVRQARYTTDSNFALANNDTAAGFVSMMQSQYPTKYWDFNSIVVTDNSCKATQTLRNASGEEVRNQSGPVISGGIGSEYINLSRSGAVTIDNAARTRGLVLNICQSDYAANFSSMATQISDSSRMMGLNCSPATAPIVSPVGVPYTWNGDKLIFGRGSEGVAVTVSYRCYTGAL